MPMSALYKIIIDNCKIIKSEIILLDNCPKPIQLPSAATTKKYFGFHPEKKHHILHKFICIFQ